MGIAILTAVLTILFLAVVVTAVLRSRTRRDSFQQRELDELNRHLTKTMRSHQRHAQVMNDIITITNMHGSRPGRRSAPDPRRADLWYDRHDLRPGRATIRVRSRQHPSSDRGPLPHQGFPGRGDLRR